ncbi:MAG: RNA-binding protein [Planctomycetota bacterium]
MCETEKTEKQWNDLKSKLAIGTIVTGEIMAHWRFGAFVSMNRIDTPFVGLIEIIDFEDKLRPITPRDFPDIETTVRAVVLGFRDSNHQVALSMKPSDLKKAEGK